MNDPILYLVVAAICVLAIIRVVFKQNKATRKFNHAMEQIKPNIYIVRARVVEIDNNATEVVLGPRRLMLISNYTLSEGNKSIPKTARLKLEFLEVKAGCIRGVPLEDLPDLLESNPRIIPQFDWYTISINNLNLFEVDGIYQGTVLIHKGRDLYSFTPTNPARKMDMRLSEV